MSRVQKSAALEISDGKMAFQLKKITKLIPEEEFLKNYDQGMGPRPGMLGEGIMRQRCAGI